VKRSEINGILREGKCFIESCQFHLPPFAYWHPEDWRRKGPEVQEIVEANLGWDVTDFGCGEFERSGLLLFTLRNGNPDDLKRGEGKLYAEKILVIRQGQVTPFHFHWDKTEDIINRAGGRLMISVHDATDDDGLADTDVSLSVDGIRRVVPAGGTITLTPGESITVSSRLYHKFWAADGSVLAGEVSLVNDDDTDNRFYEPLGRFPEIDEDEPPLHLLCTDYGDYWDGGDGV
jgi:hypothetical protein